MTSSSLNPCHFFCFGSSFEVCVLFFFSAEPLSVLNLLLPLAAFPIILPSSVFFRRSSCLRTCQSQLFLAPDGIKDKTRRPNLSSSVDDKGSCVTTSLLLVYGQVTIIFIVSVCLFVSAEFFSAVFDSISIKLGHNYVICLGLVVSPRI